MSSDSLPPSIEERLPELRTRLDRAESLLVCLDFDGTLAPIVEDPDDATITEENRAAIRALRERPSVRTAVISGRALSDVRERVGLPIDYAGNHGLELARDGSTAVHPVAEKRAATVAEVCRALEIATASLPGVSVENKGITATVHYRQAPPGLEPIVRTVTAGVRSRIDDDDDLELASGKEVFELEPTLDWNKGAAVDLLRTDCPGDPLVVYVGDDRTDESAFRVAESNGFGVLVGDDDDTAASCRVRSPTEVASLLRWLASAGEEFFEAASDERAVLATE